MHTVQLVWNVSARDEIMYFKNVASCFCLQAKRCRMDTNTVIVYIII